jgi:amino acid permease
VLCLCPPFFTRRARAFGHAGFVVAVAVQALFSFGSLVSYLLIIGDTLPPVRKERAGSRDLGRRYDDHLHQTRLAVAASP